MARVSSFKKNSTCYFQRLSYAIFNDVMRGRGFYSVHHVWYTDIASITVYPPSPLPEKKIIKVSGIED